MATPDHTTRRARKNILPDKVPDSPDFIPPTPIVIKTQTKSKSILKSNLSSRFTISNNEHLVENRKRVAEDRTGFSPDSKKLIETTLTSATKECKLNLFNKFDDVKVMNNVVGGNSLDCETQSDIPPSCSLLMSHNLSKHSNRSISVKEQIKSFKIETSDLDNLIGNDIKDTKYFCRLVIKGDVVNDIDMLSPPRGKDGSKQCVPNTTLSQIISTPNSPVKETIIPSDNFESEMEELSNSIQDMQSPSKEGSSIKLKAIKPALSEAEQQEADAIHEFMNDDFDLSFDVEKPTAFKKPAASFDESSLTRYIYLKVEVISNDMYCFKC